MPSKLAAQEEIEGDLDGYKCGIQGCGAILKTTLELVRADDATAHMDLIYILTLCPISNPNLKRNDPITTMTVSFLLILCGMYHLSPFRLITARLSIGIGVPGGPNLKMLCDYPGSKHLIFLFVSHAQLWSYNISCSNAGPTFARVS